MNFKFRVQRYKIYKTIGTEKINIFGRSVSALSCDDTGAAVGVVEASGLGDDAGFAALFHVLDGCANFRGHGAFGEVLLFQITFSLADGNGV